MNIQYLTVGGVRCWLPVQIHVTIGLDAMEIDFESFRVLFTFDTIVLFEWFSIRSIFQLFNSIRIGCIGIAVIEKSNVLMVQCLRGKFHCELRMHLKLFEMASAVAWQCTYATRQLNYLCLKCRKSVARITRTEFDLPLN